ncbi:hypothetical protein MMC25_006562 [Agyrium rufum]|nr:hypothetical protein [Agyrium rufum]
MVDRAKSIESFVKSSVLDLIIPEASERDIEEILTSAISEDDEGPSGLSAIPQRKILFFDEQLPVYVVLQTPYQEEGSLKAQLALLSTALEVHALGQSGGPSESGRDGSTSRDIIWSGKVGMNEDPIIVVEEGEDSEDEESRDMFIIWKMIPSLSRPRIRLQAPAILFKLSGSMKSAEVEIDPLDVEDPYLPSGVPFGTENLFEALARDPALKGREPYLSSHRLTRFAPAARKNVTDSYPLKVASRKAIRAHPAVSARIRYHSTASSDQDIALNASLDIEIPPYVQAPIIIETAELEFPSGTLTKLTTGAFVKLPRECHARDNLVLLYKLQPDPTFILDVQQNRQAQSTSVPAGPVSITLTATILVSPTCHPKISLQWRSTPDFTYLIRPILAAPTPSESRPTSIAAANTRSQHDTITSFGVTATIPAPKRVRVGEPFTWSIFLVNRSSQNRNLSVIIHPKGDSSHGVRDSRPIGSAKSEVTRDKRGSRIPGNEKDYGRDSVAEPYLDEITLYNLIHNRSQSTTVPAKGAHLTNTPYPSFAILSTDTSVGNVRPGGAASAEISILPLLPGRLEVEVVSIVDSETRGRLDILGSELPDVWVMEREDGVKGGSKQENGSREANGTDLEA